MQQHGKTNIASYSSFIKFVGRDSNSAKALEIYNSIKDDSIRSNASVCNSTLCCLIKCGKFHSSLKLFNQMKQAGLVPDIVTYSTVCYYNLYIQQTAFWLMWRNKLVYQIKHLVRVCLLRVLGVYDISMAI